MIDKKQMNILDVKEGVIFHGVNCKGVMGSGLAIQIREAYPVVFEKYREFLKETGGKLGAVQIVQVSETLQVGNIFSQSNYGRVKEIRYVSYDALDNAFRSIKASFGKDVPLYFPLIGAGLANGNWEVIFQMIVEHLSEHNVTIVYQ